MLEEGIDPLGLSEESGGLPGFGNEPHLGAAEAMMNASRIGNEQESERPSEGGRSRSSGHGSRRTGCDRHETFQV